MILIHHILTIMNPKATPILQFFKYTNILTIIKMICLKKFGSIHMVVYINNSISYMTIKIKV
jgi:hypothetical protein